MVVESDLNRIAGAQSSQPSLVALCCVNSCWHWTHGLGADGLGGSHGNLDSRHQLDTGTEVGMRSVGSGEGVGRGKTGSVGPEALNDLALCSTQTLVPPATTSGWGLFASGLAWGPPVL